jgi:hypothetical protein
MKKLDPLLKIVRGKLENVPERLQYFQLEKYVCHVLNDGLDFKNVLKIITKFWRDSLVK